MQTKALLSIIFLYISFINFAQNVYKTPTGTKYHTANCRSIKNVSSEISIEQAEEDNLTPCAICKPNKQNITSINGFISSSSNKNIQSDELLGTKNDATQCTSRTQAGNRCKNKTKNVNGRCHKHDK